MLEGECAIIFELRKNTRLFTIPLFSPVFYRLKIIHVSEQKEILNLCLSTHDFPKTSNPFYVNATVLLKMKRNCPKNVCVWERSYEDINTCYVPMALIGSSV